MARNCGNLLPFCPGSTARSGLPITKHHHDTTWAQQQQQHLDHATASEQKWWSHFFLQFWTNIPLKLTAHVMPSTNNRPNKQSTLLPPPSMIRSHNIFFAISILALVDDQLEHWPTNISCQLFLSNDEHWHSHYLSIVFLLYFHISIVH